MPFAVQVELCDALAVPPTITATDNSAFGSAPLGGFVLPFKFIAIAAGVVANSYPDVDLL
jgi:hypothetical protein